MEKQKVNHAADFLSAIAIISAIAYSILFFTALLSYPFVKTHIWGYQGASFGEDFIPWTSLISALIKTGIVIVLAVLLKMASRRQHVIAETGCAAAAFLSIVIPFDSFVVWKTNIFYMRQAVPEYGSVYEFALMNELFDFVSFAIHLSYVSLLMSAMLSFMAKKAILTHGRG